MRVIDQPFLTRQDILGVLLPGRLATESPFRTLRGKRAASAGFKVPLRGVRGQVRGVLHLYSTLNADAARAFRLMRLDAAVEFAGQAERLETSEPANYLKDLIAAAAGEQLASGSRRPPTLERYLARRTGDGLDTAQAILEWLARADAWLPSAGALDTAQEALIELAADASRVRSEVDGVDAASVTSFYGIVSRMDATAAELEDRNRETILVSREELEREGLAAIGQAVTLLWEALPGGGTYMLPKAAVVVGANAQHDSNSPYDAGSPSMLGEHLGPADSAWVQRGLAREPTAVPRGGLKVSES